MGRTFVGADFHIGHKHIVKSRKGFISQSQHDEFMFGLFSTLRPNDTFIGVGDMFFTREWLYRFGKLPFRKKLAIGNHDTDRECDIRDLVENWDTVDESIKRPGVIFTHRPMHPDALRGKRNCHGHQHELTIPDSRYINVSIDAAGFRLIQLEEILDGRYTTFK